MDDRRRTISSGDAMIGEALMRISNTMEAERLTKSLDYQEKLRSRSNIRLIIGIICIFIAFMMLLMSGGLLYVFIKYQDPILDAWVPLVRSIINGLNVAIQASIMKSTYGVIQKRIMVEGNIALLQCNNRFPCLCSCQGSCQSGKTTRYDNNISFHVFHRIILLDTILRN